MLRPVGGWTGNGSGGGTQIRAGSQAITNGTKTVSILFSAAMPSTSYTPIVQISNYTDLTPMRNFGEMTVSKTTLGISVEWDNNVDSGNYVAEWIVVGHQ